MTLRTALLSVFLAVALGQSALRLHAGSASARNLLALEVQRARTLQVAHALRRALEGFAVAHPGDWVEVDPTRPDLPRSSFRELSVPYAEAEARSQEAVMVRAARRAPETGVDLVDQDGETLVVARTSTGVRVMRFGELVKQIEAVWGTAVDIRLEPDPGTLPIVTPLVAHPRLLWVDSGHVTLPPPSLPFTGLGLILLASGILALDLAAQIRARATESARRTERQQVLQRLSHHLRTPAASALSLAETLRVDSLSPAERDQVRDLLLDEVRRLATGLDHLLRASRDDGGRDEAERVPVELVAWARESVPRWSVRAPGLVLHAEGPVVADVDPAQLEEAVEALLDNARKYGAPPVELQIGRRGGRAELTVADGGPGVAPAERARLVRKFERGASGQGFGLGLWVAQAVAEAHGGRLVVDGSRFTLELPLVRSP